MSLISLRFFVIVGITLLIYYLIPMRYRWVPLLGASLLFYVLSGIEETLLVVLIAVVSFLMAHVIQKAKAGGRKRSHLFLTIAVVMVLSVLAFVKICGHYNTLAEYLIVPIGLSYFSLSIIGYLLDVYWGREETDKNVGHFLLFVLYFPKIVQGPIARHKSFKEQLVKGSKFDWDQVCFGLQLVIWGIFKKIVLADRMNIVVSKVYGDLETYTQFGMVLVITMILSALQLYCDFSGYTDIARGVSQMFGIHLEQNFNHPFFAKSASEFWQRWHMTLGSWFKDYLFLPTSRSWFVKNVSKQLGIRFGASARKKTMMVLSTAVVWLATGLWHGTGINYMVWGLYWGCLIIFSEVFSNWFTKLNSILRINTSAPSWTLFRMIRTAGIFVLGKMISAQSNLYDVKRIIWSVAENVHLSDIQMIRESGLNEADVFILGIGLLTVLFVSILQEKGVAIRNAIAGWNVVPRWLFYSFSLTVVLFVGIYGPGYDTSTFAYQFF